MRRFPSGTLRERFTLLPRVKLNLAVVLSKEKIAVIPLQEQIVDKLKNFSEIEL